MYIDGVLASVMRRTAQIDIRSTCPVAMAERPHLFPCRTQQLSSPAPMVVGLTSRESRTPPGNFIVLFHSSSVVELSAVNRSVVGSNPTCGAIFLFNYIYVGPLVKWLRHRPFTAVTRVRIPYGSLIGELAQLGEHLPYKQRVGGSNPSFSTTEG